MKLKIGTAILMFLSVATSTYAKDMQLQFLPFETLVVEYEAISKDTDTPPDADSTKTTITHYFKDYGSRQAKHSQATITQNNNVKILNQLEIIEGINAYKIDLDKKTGYKTNEQDFLQKFRKISDLGSMTENQKQAYWEELGVVRTGTQTILGKKCDLFKIEGMETTTCIWNNVVLMAEILSYITPLKVITTRIEEDIDISEDKFKIPEDIYLTQKAQTKQQLNDIINEKEDTENIEPSPSNYFYQ